MKIVRVKNFLKNVKFDFRNKNNSFDFVSKIYGKQFFDLNFYLKFLNNFKNFKYVRLKSKRFFFLFSKFFIFLKFRLQFLDSIVYKEKSLLEFLSFFGFFIRDSDFSKIKGNYYIFFFNKKLLFNNNFQVFLQKSDEFLYENDKGNVIKIFQEKFFVFSFIIFERCYGFFNSVFSILESSIDWGFFFFLLLKEIFFFIFFFFYFFVSFNWFIIYCINLNFSYLLLKKN